MPDCRSRWAIQSGVGRVGSTPVTARAANWSQPAGSLTVTSYAPPSTAGMVTASATSWKPTVSAIEASRARPRIEKQ